MNRYEPHTPKMPERLTWLDVLANVFFLTILICLWLIVVGLILLSFTIFGWWVIPITAVLAAFMWALVRIGERGGRW